MNQLSKTEQVLKEMRQYLIDILVLSEIRWTGNGLEKFSDGYVMAFSGHPSVHRAGEFSGFGGGEVILPKPYYITSSEGMPST
ncbi:hypothetical protein QYM36_006625 [Artemia franciscana]|uniref:Uncharacterized protein n=1 Tax=Artemia franciscana TaxID=6661 RepID=A0AA88IAR5_ARTSF|nr:hypothetical protein QYM36_006625 [Artemia franciscana]